MSTVQSHHHKAVSRLCVLCVCVCVCVLCVLCVCVCACMCVVCVWGGGYIDARKSGTHYVAEV